MVQIVTASGEINASIIKSFLESNGIKSSYGPESMPNIGSAGPNVPQTIYVDDDKSEQALRLLKKQGLITE